MRSKLCSPITAEPTTDNVQTTAHAEQLLHTHTDALQQGTAAHMCARLHQRRHRLHVDPPASPVSRCGCTAQRRYVALPRWQRADTAQDVCGRTRQPRPKPRQCQSAIWACGCSSAQEPLRHQMAMPSTPGSPHSPVADGTTATFSVEVFALCS